MDAIVASHWWNNHHRAVSNVKTAARRGDVRDIRTARRPPDYAAGRSLETRFSTRPFVSDAQPPRAPRLRPSRVLALIAVLIWSSSVACLWTNESRLVFQARHSRFRGLVPGKGLIQLMTTDGIRLDAVSLTHERAPAYWILFCPPSGRTIHGRVRRHLESLRATGYNVFAFDYRGFGRNAGTPSEAGVYEDALTAYRYLTQELDVAPPRIILAGRSLGSAVAIELATRVPSGGLLLLSAIDSVPATASRFYFWAPVRLLASQQFDSMAKAPRIVLPVLQVHASNDWLVPIEVARALFRQFPGRKVMLELAGGHNEAGFADESLRRAIGRLWPNPG
jgi:pimeloyl-ACP methyl ester carboxylesterase